MDTDHFDGELLDPDALQALRDLDDDADPDFSARTLEQYLQQSRDLLAELDPLPSNDRVRRILHQWKGASLNVGAVALAEALAELEMLFPNDMGSDEVVQLSELFKHTEHALRAYLRPNPA